MQKQTIKKLESRRILRLEQQNIRGGINYTIVYPCSLNGEAYCTIWDCFDNCFEGICGRPYATPFADCGHSHGF